MHKYKFQIFIENFYLSVLSLIKILFLSRFFIGKFKGLRKNDLECTILANGPSLSESRTNAEFLNHKTFMGVNFFPETEMFDKLQPQYLVIAAPELWLEDVEEKFKENSRHLFETISTKVNWEMILFMPVGARKFKEWKKKVEDNNNILIKYFNATPIEGYNFFMHTMFKLNLGMPRPHNVLIPSLMLTINMGFKKIYLLGADHSWLKEISVNNKNQVLINQKHFYDENTSVAKPMNKRGKGTRKMHEVLLKFYYSFYSYFVIKEYAEKKNVEIINSTPASFIDAFERASINKNK